jgi:hypothetical protein
MVTSDGGSRPRAAVFLEVLIMTDFRKLRGAALVSGVIVLLSAGCTRKINNAPVAADKAREALQTALESWKKGDKIDALQSANPPIHVIDVDWQSGAVLKDFKLVSDGEAKDAMLYCPVKLTVRDAGGKEVQYDVTYMISTAPNITVARKMF